MAKEKSKHKHTFRNGTVLTVQATEKGLRIFWKEVGDEKRHPSLNLPWSKVASLKRNLKPKATPAA